MNDKLARMSPVSRVTLASPLLWLGRGWRDFVRHPLPGLLHGLCVSLFGALLYLLAERQFGLLVGAFSGFLLVAPVLATGLYAVSRELEQDRLMSLSELVALWRGRDSRLVSFGLWLGLAGTLWVLSSASLLVLLAPAPIDTVDDFLHHVVLSDSPLLFELWMLLGGLLAAPIFASSVMTLPMLLDRDCSMPDAVRASWRAVADHPLALALWASLIAGLVIVGLLSFLLGLLVLVPLLGHASWHAYRDLSAAATKAGREV